MEGDFFFFFSGLVSVFLTFTQQPNVALNRNNRGFFLLKFLKTFVHKYVIFTRKFELFYNL